MVRFRLVFGTLAEDAGDGGGPARSGLAGDIQIEAGCINAQAEINRTQGPFLPDRVIKIRQLLGRFKTEQFRIAIPAQFVKWYQATVNRH